MATVYEINKGINRSLEFKGIKAQYIIYLAAGLVMLLLLFAITFMLGVNLYACVGTILLAGYGLFAGVKRYSKKFGEHGLIKKAAQSRLPTYITTTTRNLFIQLSENDHDENEKTGERISYLQSRR